MADVVAAALRLLDSWVAWRGALDARSLATMGAMSPPPNKTSGRSKTPALVTRAGARRPFDLGELVRYRELVFFLALRDVKVRYKQTVLGVVWAVLQPLLQAGAFALIFRHATGVAPEGVSYALFVFVGMVPWQLVSTATLRGGGCLVSNQMLVTRVYFPRMALPIASIAMGVADSLLTLVLLLAVLLARGWRPGLALLALPLCITGAALTALGASLWLSALQVRYRDVTHVLGFLIQVWLLATPVIYATEAVVPPAWRWVYALNPLVAVVEATRAALLDLPAPSGSTVAASTGALVVLLVSGAIHFRNVERTLADEV